MSAGDKATSSNLIDGTFPDYARVIPQDFARTATAPTLALIEALGRVSTLSGEKGRRVKLSFERDTLEISLHNADDGSEAQDTLDTELDGEPLAIGLQREVPRGNPAQVGSDTVKINLGRDNQQAARDRRQARRGPVRPHAHADLSRCAPGPQTRRG